MSVFIESFLNSSTGNNRVESRHRRAILHLRRMAPGTTEERIDIDFGNFLADLAEVEAIAAERNEVVGRVGTNGGYRHRKCMQIVAAAAPTATLTRQSSGDDQR